MYKKVCRVIATRHTFSLYRVLLFFKLYNNAKIYAPQTHEVAILLQLLYMNNSLANVSHRNLQLYTKNRAALLQRGTVLSLAGSAFL